MSKKAAQKLLFDVVFKSEADGLNLILHHRLQAISPNEELLLYLFGIARKSRLRSRSRCLWRSILIKLKGQLMR